MTQGARRVLIINQHGDNRGDEAAMRATIRAIDARFSGSLFTVLIQVRDRNLRMPIAKPDVVFHSIYLSLGEATSLVAYAALAAIGVWVPALLAGSTAAIVAAYRTADVVITAPGGPYFGDIYVDHELVHWFYVYLARLHSKPVFQYAPSCGPFRIRPMNWLRRRFYRWIGVLVVREDVSRRYLWALLGSATPIHVTIDAAIQEHLPAASRGEYFRDDREHLRSRLVVAVTLHRYSFPGDADPRGRQTTFECAVLACLEHLANREPCHFLFFPQLCGSVNNDVAFHRYLGNRLPAGVSWEIVDSALDSDQQRALFGLADFCVASRYHPQIFATSHGVPGLFISYEHKQRGYLHQLGLDNYVFDIRQPDAVAMKRAVDEALLRRVELSEHLRQRIQPLRQLARMTTDLLEDFATDRPVSSASEGASVARAVS